MALISGETFMLWNMMLSFGAPLALILWELRRMKRYRDEADGSDDGSANRPLPVAPTPNGDEDLPPLPDCLRPDLKPASAALERVLARV